ncbi:hypothetical protein GCM10010216_27090 [Streptomyces flaveolus]|nr:hypothetical protein GCM10010216_27090 [Streptomyces flaveolus]
MRAEGGRELQDAADEEVEAEQHTGGTQGGARPDQDQHAEDQRGDPGEQDRLPGGAGQDVQGPSTGGSGSCPPGAARVCVPCRAWTPRSSYGGPPGELFGGSVMVHAGSGRGPAATWSGPPG